MLISGPDSSNCLPSSAPLMTISLSRSPRSIGPPVMPPSLVRRPSQAVPQHSGGQGSPSYLALQQLLTVTTMTAGCQANLMKRSYGILTRSVWLDQVACLAPVVRQEIADIRKQAEFQK